MRWSLRPWVQGALLLGFLALFGRTAYRGADLLDWPVHLVFHLDPLAALAAVLAVGLAALWSAAWIGAGVLLLFTGLLGRFFCGWMCPLGAALEAGGAGLRRAGGMRGPWLRLPRGMAAGVLAALLAAGLLGLPLLGLLDPLSLFLRSLALTFHPTFDAGVKGLLSVLSLSSHPPVQAVGDALYRAADPLLAYGRPTFLLAALTAVVFAALFALELLAPRTWCTSLCPLGALLGVASRLSPFRRRRALECGPCTACGTACPTGAAAGEPVSDPALCIQCGRCERVCAQGGRRPEAAAPGLAPPVSPGRRALLASAGGGALLALTSRVRAEEREPAWDFLRPPGAAGEAEFRMRCIRCGACMRVCPQGALHPALFNSGWGGLWTPRLVPRLGYCEYHCRLCGQVCPTGAIGYLEPGEKEQVVLGIAVFEKDRCLPYRNTQNCLVCEEHCPTAPKAIVFREEVRTDSEGVSRAVKLPEVVERLCVGCGICETRCPLPGAGAIRVARERPGDLSIFF
ncbi:MAG: 4Fe-4S binding protein [Deferrisomatales bacterium]|nr:4Fe-4S binding protein [Deferrisomatales bacterium]